MMNDYFPQQPGGTPQASAFDDPRMRALMAQQAQGQGGAPAPGAPMPPSAQAPGAPQAPMPPGAAANPGAIDPNVVKLMLAQGSQSSNKMQIDRQRKMADMMRGNMQQLNDPRGNMVSGHYVGPNLGTAAIAGLGGYLANRSDDKAQAKAGEMDAAREKAMAEYFAQFGAK